MGIDAKFINLFFRDAGKFGAALHGGWHGGGPEAPLHGGRSSAHYFQCSDSEGGRLAEGWSLNLLFR